MAKGPNLAARPQRLAQEDSTACMRVMTSHRNSMMVRSALVMSSVFLAVQRRQWQAMHPGWLPGMVTSVWETDTT
ncbi:hypothetical protein [Amycolatopsis sp. NPDC051061]|uniref:hypothetical protein n=1 Tax=Amycolatopsis sp. NPDC051061 TaxID=3155042 RepID=UPI00341211F5